MLNFAIQTARDAGSILAERFGRKIEIANKSELGGLMDEAAYAKHTA